MLEILARFALIKRMRMQHHRTQLPESFSTICSGPLVVVVAKNAKACTHEHIGQAETSASCFQLKASRRHERADIFDQARGQKVCVQPFTEGIARDGIRVW